MSLKKLASELGCGTNVRFQGRIDNMSEFYGAVDVFVLPSIAEGLPRTLIEAMASGVLCIAGSVAASREILDSGRCGILVPPKDTYALEIAMLKAANMQLQEKNSIVPQRKSLLKETIIIIL